jgi:hypothetical protein
VFFLSPKGSVAEKTPLTVLFSFLSRADATPLGERSRAAGHILDNGGNVIVDPAADFASNAFAPDPNPNFEIWGEYWRKLHGVRFLRSDTAQDQETIDRLLRYDQIHRLAAGLTSQSPLPYLPALDPAGRLFDTIIGHVEPYRRPTWDGVTYLNFANLDDLGIVLSSDGVRQKILPEDQVIFRDLAPVLARQFIVMPNVSGDDAFILVKTHIRRAELDREAFQRRWLSDHTSIVMKQPETRRLVRRYVQLHNIGPQEYGQPFFHPATSRIDGVTMMAFALMKNLETFLLSESYSAIQKSRASHRGR